jgi:hypothetical protein
MKICQICLTVFFFAVPLTATHATSVYTLTESFGAEKIAFEFKGALINGSSTLIGVTEVDKVFINGIPATNNGNPAGFTEDYSSTLSTNAQIDLSNALASNFSISETGNSLHIGQTYSSPFFHDVIQSETGGSSLFLNASFSAYDVNTGAITVVPAPSAMSLFLIGLSCLIQKLRPRLRNAEM